ncbi:adenylyl-sulfate kinase [Brevundimonas staleyi]|uniref:Adenylyl-sulfate kinase n=1 Tax=Brevundimonas staleyi TaxID=74326 RepID=A0ABW0FVR3_9CAUL
MDGVAFRLPSPGPAEAERGLLRFLTCGSVDDGKSTLIGRLLFETGQVRDDHLATLERDSPRFGTTGAAPDYALLLDGLEAEREQGITIDVAYRYFSSARRSFIVADTPGHAQYTRNMATGASTSDLAVILVDATRGITDQTERHSRIVSLFGIRQVILAVNKMDRVGGSQATFDAIETAYRAFARDLGFEALTVIPLSARDGDNLTTRSRLTPWFAGPTLLEALDRARTDVDLALERPFRFPVQWVNRPDAGFRGYAGTVASGRVRAGDRVVVGPSGQVATIDRIVTWEGDQPSARAGDAVTLVLAEAVDVSRGDVLAHPHDRPASVERFVGRLLWMDETPLDPARSYLLRLGTRTVAARVRVLDAASDGTAPVEGVTLAMNAIARVALTLSSPVAFDPFASDPLTGGFILIDRETHATVAAGTALHPLDQPADIHVASGAVDRRQRERLNGHRGAVVWFTGLSGSGKSTLAVEVERCLHGRGIRTVLLDGDNLRHGLNRDLGFSEDDRAENIRRAGEVARLFAETGVVTLCAFISPRQAQRDAVRTRMDEGLFLEVFVDAPVALCRARDPKGLYAKADRRAITGLTGVDAPYEPPVSPDLTLSTEIDPVERCAARVIARLEAEGVI